MKSYILIFATFCFCTLGCTTVLVSHDQDLDPDLSGALQQVSDQDLFLDQIKNTHSASVQQNQTGTSEDSRAKEVNKIGAELNNGLLVFGANQVKVGALAEQKLVDLAELLKQNGKLKVKLTGATDWSGDAKKNLELSKLRASGVRDILLREGVPAQRILVVYSGRVGSKKSNLSAKNRAKNRKVIIEII